MRFALIALMLAACGPDSSSSYTYADLCSEGADAVCERFQTCGLLTPPATADGCRSQFVLGCCTNQGTCGQAADPNGAEQCFADVTTFDCTTLAQGNLPVSCLTL